MQRQCALITVAGMIVVTSWTLLAAGQLPLAPVRTSGQTITPVYEGWYENADGSCARGPSGSSAATRDCRSRSGIVVGRSISAGCRTRRWRWSRTATS